MFRAIFWWLVFTAATVFYSIAASIAWLFDRSGAASHNLNRLWAKTAIWASGCRIEMIGEENLLKDRGQLIVSNHQSGFDIYALTAVLPIQIRWISKKELFKIPFLGWGMKASGYISIDREDPRKALTSLKEAVKKVDMGFSPVIFPEGTRTEDGKLREFKKGTLYVARKGKSPVTPVTIIGTFQIMKKKSLKINPHDIKIVIGKSIAAEKIQTSEESDILRLIRDGIQKNLTELS